jgi:hypothetical protein
MGNTISTIADSALHRERSSPAWQAYQILHIAFTVAPILAGADKFLHLMVNWTSIWRPGSPRFRPSAAMVSCWSRA